MSLFRRIAIIIFFIIDITVAKKVICNLNQTINYDKEGIIYFETPNFPIATTDKCNITFNYGYEKFRTMIVITNFIDIYGVKLYSNNYEINWDSTDLIINKVIYNTIFTLTSDTNNPIQGYVVTDTWSNGCPLMSLTAVDPYKLTDVTQILYLSSSYSINIEVSANTTIKCQWRFTSPKSTKFKLVILNGMNNLATLTVNYGMSQSKIIKAGQNPLVVQYLQGSKINIFYNDPPPTDLNDIYNLRGHLAAYLTMIKIYKRKTKANCKVSKNGTKTTWELSGGYSNNANCSLSLLVPVDKELKVHLTYLHIENGVDIIRFYFDERYRTYNSTFVATFEKLYDYVFQANKNGYNKNIFFQFISDGSIQKQGFTMVFYESECKCNEPNVVIPCFGAFDFGIMSNDDVHYCGDLACNFTFSMNPLCPNRFMHVQIVVYYGRSYNTPFFDYFQILSNDKTLLESKDFINENETNVAILSPKNKNLLIFSSITGIYDKSFRCTVTPIDQPRNHSRIILTNDKSTFVIDAGLLLSNNYISVELSADLIAEKDVLEIFTNLMTSGIIIFYGSPNFDDIIIDSTTDGMILLRAMHEHTKNCYFKDNVFNSNNAAEEDAAISMVAKEDGDCEMIILTFPYTDYVSDTFIPEDLSQLHQIKKMWTTANEDNVQIFSRGKEDELLLEFNNTSENTWMNLASSYYTIILPANTSAMFDFTSFSLEGDILYLPYPYHALTGTPYYGTAKPYPINSPFGMFGIPPDFTLNIKVLKFDVSPYPIGFAQFVNFKTKSPINITSVNETFSFTNIAFILWYLEYDIFKTGVLLEMEMVKN